MKSRNVLWVGLAVAAALLVLSLDPFGWLGRRSADPGAGPAAPAAATKAEPADPMREVRTVVAASAEGPAVFRLLDAEDQPVGAALVLVARDGELLHDEVSDAQGRVSLPAAGGAATLVARIGRRPIASWPVRLDAGLHELRFPQGARVAGRLEVEHGAPAPGLSLRLWADAPLLPAEPVPQPVWERLGIDPSQALVLSCESDADGRFAWTGLAPQWSGSLRLPRGWRIRSASHGQIEPSAARLRLESPVQGLLLRLAAPAMLRGRLLSRSDATPLESVPLSAVLAAPEGESGNHIGTSTDVEGRFELVARGERIAGLELRLGPDPGKGRLLLALGAAELPPDGDLGDVFVDDLRAVEFVLHSSLGGPIRAGHALVGGLRSEPTDANGRGVLPWVPSSSTVLRAEAVGFVPAEVEFAPALSDPLAIVLEPACALEVKLVPPASGDPELFRLVLRREEGVTAGPCRDRDEQRAFVEPWSLPPVELWNAPTATFLAAQPSRPGGMATFRALAVGVPIELEVRGITGPAVYHRRTLEPFRSGETRRIEVALGEDSLVFRGRVLDAEGQALVRATVQLDGQILDWTDENGAFLCFLTDRSPGTLVLQHQAAATLFLHDYVAPPDAREVEFRLHPARAVLIDVVDAAGEPVPQAEVRILQEGFTTSTLRAPGGRHHASSLTDNPFRIEVRVGGRRYLQEHTADRPEARVVVPVHGSLVVRVAESTTDGRSGRLILTLEPIEGTLDDPLAAVRRCEPGALTLELPAVLPGSYLARLTYEPTEVERAAGAAEASSAAVPVTVEPAARVEIRIDAP